MNETGGDTSRASAGPAETDTETKTETETDRAPRRTPPARRRRSLLGVIAGVGNPTSRLGLTALAAGAVAVTAVAAAVAASGSAGTQPDAARLTGEIGPDTAASSPSLAWAYAAPAVIGDGHAVVTQLPPEDTPLVLTAEDQKDCPAAAVACVDLARHITWLQSDGKVSFGPVRMEPGKPGSGPHATPTGTFQVQWKAGPNLISNIYNEPMPWAVFFAPGGVAFHAGSLTQWSHGCVHLTLADAHYYNEHLPIGAEIVVF
jgi:L,D-transpeptidase catalytic domain